MTGRIATLRGLLGFAGVLAILTGIYVMATGASGQTDGGGASASLDSELRFFAAFWTGYGVAALLTAARKVPDRTAVRALALVMFVGGLARAVSLIDRGEPHTLFIGLMIAELIAPLAFVALTGRAGRDPYPEPSR